MAADEKKPPEKKKRKKKKKARVGESDPFRGLLFSKMISDSLPHTWERTNMDSPHLGPSHNNMTIEDIARGVPEDPNAPTSEYGKEQTRL